MSQTLQEKYTAKLLNLGAKPVQSRSSKYRVFEYTFRAKNRDGIASEFTRFVFLGKAGAIRWNKRNAVDGSISNPSFLMKKLEVIKARAEGFRQEAA